MSGRVITARENGPYRVPGPLVLVDSSGVERRMDQETVSLCRCGGSSSKPLCDGTHRKIAFEASAAELKLDSIRTVPGQPPV